jgi:DNA-binding IclR family transcriptional regulator
MSKIVERTLDLLELFAQEKRPLSLSDIARLLRIPVSSCHDVLQTMQSRGYLYELAPRAGYYPTQRLLGLSKEIGDNDPILLRAELLLRSLRDSLDETVLLAKVSGLQANYLLVFEPSHPLRFSTKIGEPVRGLFATSGGKALLSTLDPPALDACLKTAKLKAITRHTLLSKQALRNDIELGRERHWFLNHEESQEGVTTLSAPLRWNDTVYIVTIAGPSPRLYPQLERAAELLTNICASLEMRSNSEDGATSDHRPKGGRRSPSSEDAALVASADGTAH